MAKARMLHKTISTSLQVNKLSLPSRLLFTWMIAHADDDGRMRGDPEYIKATVVPMTKWSFKEIRQLLEEISKVGLIFWWANPKNNEWFVEFINWKKYQQIKSDRYKPSDLPSFNEESGTALEPNGIQSGTESAPQSNISEYNRIEVNKSESNTNIAYADETSFKKVVNPKDFEPKSADELAAKEVWEELEPNNPLAFGGTYLRACRKGLPSNMFYQFRSEIKHDDTIKNPGAVFNKKVDDYFSQSGQ